MTYKFAAEEARRIHGETIPMDAAPGGENRIAYTMRQGRSRGRDGNTLVLKPAGQTPLTAQLLAELLHAAEALEVGGVMINDLPTFRVDHMPYGGVKESGTGREGLKYAIQEMTEMKLVCFKK